MISATIEDFEWNLDLLRTNDASLWRKGLGDEAAVNAAVMDWLANMAVELIKAGLITNSKYVEQDTLGDINAELIASDNAERAKEFK